MHFYENNLLVEIMCKIVKKIYNYVTSKNDLSNSVT